MKHQANITPYLGYIRALFLEDRRDYCVVKATGLAIETALKVVQVTREEMGNIHSLMRIMLQADNGSTICDERFSILNSHPTRAMIDTWDDYMRSIAVAKNH